MVIAQERNYSRHRPPQRGAKGQDGPLPLGKMYQPSWRRSIVVRTLVSAGELSLSCARLLAGWVFKPSAIGQPTWPTQPLIPQGSVNEY